MLNGRYDSRFPLETNLLNLFLIFWALLKRTNVCVIYETDHYVAKADMIKEVLGWLDKYFGPVNYQPDK